MKQRLDRVENKKIDKRAKHQINRLKDRSFDSLVTDEQQEEAVKMYSVKMY